MSGILNQQVQTEYDNWPWASLDSLMLQIQLLPLHGQSSSSVPAGDQDIKVGLVILVAWGAR